MRFSNLKLVGYLQKVSNWATQHHQQLFLGEFGVANSQTCLDALHQMAVQLQHPARKGWTYWAGGEWWHNYAFSIQPDATHPVKPQLQVLKPYLTHRSKVVIQTQRKVSMVVVVEFKSPCQPCNA